MFKKAISLLVLMCAAVLFVLPVYGEIMMPFPEDVMQANGKSITIRAFGDEYFSWIEEESTGFVIAYDPDSSNWCYAYIQNDEIRPDAAAVVGAGMQAYGLSNRIKSDALTPLLNRVDYSVYDIEMELSSWEQRQMEEGITPYSIYNNHESALLVLLIEYNDIPITQTMQFWHNRHFNMGEKSVNKFYYDNSGGTFKFKPAISVSNRTITSGLPSGVTSVELYNGIAKVKLNKNHPSNNNGSYSAPGNATFDDVRLAYSAVRTHVDFSTIPRIGTSTNIRAEDFAVTAIIAGWSNSVGGNTQVQRVGGVALLSRSGGVQISVASNGNTLSSMATQAELYSGGDVSGGVVSGTVRPLGIGTIVHEVGHLMSLPDLYDTSGSSNGVGNYCVMGSGNWGRAPGDAYSGLTPPAFSAWTKINLGYLTPTVIDQSDTADVFELKSFNEARYSDYNVLKVTNTGLDPKQYFLAENRQSASGWDAGFNNSAYNGILLLQVDESVYDSWNRAANNNWRHRSVDIVGAGQNGANSNRFYASTNASRNTLNNLTEPSNHFYEYGHTNCQPNGPSDCHKRDVPSGIQIIVESTSSASMYVAVGLGSAVADITGIPSEIKWGAPLTLEGVVVPSSATNKTITWNMVNAGSTGATLSGNVLSTTGTGTVRIKATITNGVAPGTNFTKEFTIAVNKADPTVTWPSGLVAQYGQRLSDITLPGNGTSTPAGSFTWTTPGNLVGAVGSRQHNMTFTPNNNTLYETLTRDVSVSVSKANTLIATNHVIYINSGDTGSKTFDLNQIVFNHTDFGTRTYNRGTFTNTSNVLTAQPTITGGNILNFTSAGQISGTATQVIRITTTNYQDVNVTITFEVSNKTATNVTVTPPADITYGETLGNPTATTAAGNVGTFTYRYIGLLDDNVTAYDSTAKPTQPGYYTVQAILNSATHSGDGEANFVILQKTLTWATAGSANDKPYDGTTNATQQIVPTLGGIVGNDASSNGLTVQTGSLTFASANVGFRAVTATGYGITGANAWKYKPPTSQPNFGPAAISPKVITFAIATIAPVPYTGSQLTPAVTVRDGSTQLTQGTAYTVSYGANINAGTNAGSVSVTGIGNYAGSDGTANFTIERIEYPGMKFNSVNVIAGQTTSNKTFTLPTLPAGARYAASGRSSGVLISGTPTVSNGVLTFSTTNQVAETPEATGTIEISVTGASNYNDYVLTITVVAIELRANISGNITGTTGIALTGTQDVTVSLTGDTFASALSSNWITNLPAGLTQTVSRVDATTARIRVSGTPTAASTAPIAVTIPAGMMVTFNQQTLTTTGGLASVYNIQASTYILEWSGTPGSFTALDYGYATGRSVTYTIRNTGNQTVTGIAATLNTNSDFRINTGLSTATLAPNATATVTVTSNTGLDAGTYTGVLTIKWTDGDGATGITQNLSQTVNKAAYTGTRTVTDSVMAGQATIGKILTLPELPAGASYAATGTAGGTTPALISGTPNISGGVLTYNTTNRTANTSATITIIVTGAKNYLDYTMAVTVTAIDVSASISGNITGFMGITLTGTQRVTVNLVGDTFANQLTDNWITNLPAGLTQTVARTNNNTATITVSGTPTAVSTTPVAVTIPSGALVTLNQQVLTASGGSASAYDIKSTAYTLEWDGTPGSFAMLNYGYTIGSNVTYTIKNTGNQTLTGITAALNTNSDFKISTPLSATTLEPNATATVTVTSNTGLNEGAYTDVLTIRWTGGNGTTGITQNLSQTVINNVEAFITRIYKNVLERDPEPEGLEFWTGKLKSGEATAAIIIDEFFFSPEFLNKVMDDTYYMKIAYNTFMDRDPDTEGLFHWLATLEDGFSRRYVLAEMIKSQEFKGICENYEIFIGEFEFRAVTGIIGIPQSFYLGKSLHLAATVEPKSASYTKVQWQIADDGGTGAQLSTDNRYLSANSPGTIRLQAVIPQGLSPAEDYTQIFEITAEANPVQLEAFVARMYQIVLDREAEQNGFDFWVNTLLSGHQTGTNMVAEFFFSNEFLERKVSDTTFLEIAYRTLMDREPDDEGMAHWLNELNSGKSRMFVLSEMVGSPEFSRICASYGITVGQLNLTWAEVEVFVELDVSQDVVMEDDDVEDAEIIVDETNAKETEIDEIAQDEMVEDVIIFE